MGNAAGGNIFGASRLRESYPGVTPTPIIPPTPSPALPPITTPGGPVSDIIKSPVTGAPVSGGAAATTVDALPITGGASYVSPAANTATTLTPGPSPIGGPITGGPVTDIINRAGALTIPSPLAGGSMVNNPAVKAPNPNLMTKEEWNDKYRQDAETRAQVPGGGIISDIVAAPKAQTPTPAVPVSATPAAPITTTQPKTRTKKAVETDPYERWKQLGRPGGSFDAWKASQ